jgi:hypothetical protein
MADETHLTPDEAFAVLGDEIRMGILRALGRADQAVSFSTLYDRVDVDDSSQFNYHLDRMVGHFVARTDDGYRLDSAGRRVVEAVLSGAVTGRPDLSRTEVEEPCPYCGSAVEIAWHGEGVDMFCTSCAGRYGAANRPDGETVEGYLGQHPLPPAGVRDRDADDVLQTAWTWGNLEILALASGVCPRCSATVEWETELCESHDSDGDICPQYDDRFALSVAVACTNCILQTGGEPVVALAAETDLLALLTETDRNPVSPETIHRVEAVHGDYEEEVISPAPLRARYTFEADGDRLSLTVDGDLNVLETSHTTG